MEKFFIIGLSFYLIATILFVSVFGLELMIQQKENEISILSSQIDRSWFALYNADYQLSKALIFQTQIITLLKLQEINKTREAFWNDAIYDKLEGYNFAAASSYKQYYLVSNDKEASENEVESFLKSNISERNDILKSLIEVINEKTNNTVEDKKRLEKDNSFLMSVKSFLFVLALISQALSFIYLIFSERKR